MKTPERGSLTETMKKRLVHLEGGIVEVAEAYNKVKKALCGNTNVPLGEVLQTVDQLKSRLAQVERERDAAVRIVHGLCLHCKNEDSKDETCRECMYYPYRFVYGTGDTYVDNWVWRGVCEENTKEQNQGEKQV